MRTWLVLIAVVGLGDVAMASPPSAYRCNPGTSKPGVGCICPQGFQARRDGENTAICHGRAPARKPAPEPAAKPARAARTHTSPKLAAAPIRLVAKPLPPLAPSFRGTNDAYAAAWAAIAANKLQPGFEQLARLARHQDPAVRRAALEDAARVYFELGTPEAAAAAFRSLADAPIALDTLGKLYLAKPNADGALAVYRGLGSAYPAHPDRCAWLVAAGRAAAASATVPLVDQAAAATATATAWKRIERGAKSTTCRDGAAALVGDLARWAHASGALDVAEPLYLLFGSAFPELPSAPERAYDLAELRWKRAEAQQTTTAWELAAITFTDAARTGKLTPAVTQEAASAAVLAWKNARAKEPPLVARRPTDPEDVDDTSPRSIGARDLQLIASLDLYLATVKDPADAELPDLKFLRANTLRRYNHFDEAVAQFRDIVKQHPGADVAEYAANLALDSLDRVGRVREMLELTDELLADIGFLAGKDRLGETLLKIKRAGLQKRGVALAAEGSPAKAIECGRTFIEAYNADPLAADNDLVLFDAMVCFEKGEGWASSLQVFAVFEQYHAKSRLFPKAKEMAAIARTKLGK